MSVAVLIVVVVALSFFALAISLFCFLVGVSVDLIIMFADYFNSFMDRVLDFSVILKRRAANRLQYLDLSRYGTIAVRLQGLIRRL